MKFTKAIELWNNGLLNKIPNSDIFSVKQIFSWYLNYQDKKEVVIIPINFKTNFWSIPRLLRFFFNPIKFISYILHDFLYSPEWFIYNLETKTKRRPTRKEADYILLEALNIEWALSIEKTCIYFWVRIWGWCNFDNVSIEKLESIPLEEFEMLLFDNL